MPRHGSAFALPLILALGGAAPSAHAQGAAAPERVTAVPAAGPVFSDTGPDAVTYGAAAGFPLGTRLTASRPENLVAVYSHFDELFPSRPVRHAATPFQFKRVAEPEISYSFKSDRFSIEDYLGRHPTTGLLDRKSVV